MANDKKFVVKNGLLAPNASFANSTGGVAITASLLSNVTANSLSFTGTTGQLFSITDSMTGTIFAVNDISGVPSIEVDDTGDIRFAQLTGNSSFGTSLNTHKVYVQGNTYVNGTMFVGGTVINSTFFGGQANNADYLDGLHGNAYVSNASAVITFLSNAAAVTTFLSNAAAVVTFASNASLQGYGYLSNAAARTTYLSNAAAVTTFLSNAAAVTTYVSNASLQGYAYLSNAAAVTTFVSNSALTGYNLVNTTGTFTMSGAYTFATNPVTINNNIALRFKAISGSPVYFIQQSDDNFVFYSTDTANNPRAVYSIFANSATSNLSFSVRASFGGGINIPTGVTVLDSTGSQGTAGQVLTSNGAGNVYWSTVSGGTGGVNSAAQYNWTNTHTFNANVSFKDDIALDNANAIYFNSITDANWRMGRSTGAFTKWFYTGNTIDIVIANTVGEGFAIGLNGVNTYFETGYRGTFVANSITIGSGASNTIISNNTITTTGISTTNVTASGNVTADIVAASNNGNGTNFKVGDDAWIGDINIADTMRIMGQQSNNNGYIVFGIGDTNSLGRSGTGPLTYTATFTANVVNAASHTVGATVVANSTGTYATQLGGLGATSFVSNSALQTYGYLSNAAAVTTFLSNAAAVTTYVSNASLQGYGYLSNAAAQTTYLSNAAAIVTYVSNASLQGYAYLSNAAAQTTYLSNAAAVTTFASNASLQGYGYLSNAAAVTIFTSNASLQGYGYLSNAAAVTTFTSNAALQGYGYLSNAAAVTTFLSNAAAVTTFASNASLQGYGYLSNAAAVVTFVSNSALQGYGYLSNAAAQTTYLSNAAAVTTFASNASLQGYGYLSNAAAVTTFVSNAAFISDAQTFTGLKTFNANTTFNANVVLNAGDHIVLSQTSGISANSSFGSAGQVLTTSGSAVYWSTPAAGAGVNTDARYVWTNNQIFNANIGVGGNSSPAVGLQIGTNYGLVSTTIASTNSININCASGNYFLATANGSATVINFTNAPANTGYGFVLVLANGGSNSVTWANTPKWPGGVAPVLSPSSGVDVLVFFTNDGGTTWRGNLSILNSA